MAFSTAAPAVARQALPAAAAAAGSDWRAAAGAAVEKGIELWYQLDAGYEG